MKRINFFFLKNSRRLAYILPVVVLCFAASSRANFEQLAVSAKALSLGNAVTAYPPGVMSIHYNPSGLSMLEDDERSSGFTYMYSIKKRSKFIQDSDYPGILGVGSDPVSGASGASTSGAMNYPVFDNKNFMGFPSFGISHRKPGSKWTFGFGMYAPFAAGLNHGSAADPARFGGERIYSYRFVYAAPGVSYQVSDTLSIGFSLGLGRTARGIKQDLRSPNDIVAITDIIGQATEGLEIPILSELTLPEPWLGGGLPTYGSFAKIEMDLKDDLDTSYNAGLLWQPFKWISFGTCYQSEAKSKPSGEYTFSYSEKFQRFVNWFGRSPVTVTLSTILAMPVEARPAQHGTVTMKNLSTPRRFQSGVMFKPFEMLKFMFDVNWTNWSEIKREVYIFDQDITLFEASQFIGYTLGQRTYVIERDLKDIWNTNYGIEVKPFHWMSLRFGFEERESYVRDKLFDLTLPIQDMDIYTCGIGLEFDSHWRLDLAGAYMKSDTLKLDYNDDIKMTSSGFFDTLYNHYPGMDYEQKTTGLIFSIGLSYSW